jgi:glycosidase
MLLIWLTPLLAGCQTAKPYVDVKDSTWWKDAVFYEIFVRSFADSNGDGIGDFKGLTAKLDYLNDGKPETKTDLGVTGLWLMPINPSPSYHGYDVSDYLSVNPQYGTMDDFKQFLAEAHKRGIHVLMDFVINHTSTQHPWFVAAAQGDPKYRDYYIWSKTNPNYQGPWGEQVWYKQGAEYYYAIFDPAMPDLNYKNPAVTQEILAAASFWVKDVGIDGFRVDAAKHLVEDGQTQENTTATHAWYKGNTPLIQANPLKDWQPAQKPLLVGEVSGSSDSAAKYEQNGELDLVFNFDLGTALLTAAKAKYGQMAASSIDRQVNTFQNLPYASFLTNHDQDRVMTTLGGDADAARTAAAILLTMPGIPFIYYGEEIGMSGGKPDAVIRSPMQWSSGQNAGFSTGTPWQKLIPDYDKKNVEAQSTDPKSLWSLYRDLIQVRSQNYALRTGKYIPVTVNDSKLFVELRAAESESVLVIINASKEAVKGAQLSWLASPLKGSYQLTTIYGSGKMTALKIGEKGEIAKYQPLAEIPAGAVIIARLTP